MEQLQERYRSAIKQAPTQFVRYLDSKINWEARLIGILGARGVGKTILLRQHIKLYDNPDTSLYVDAGDIYFTSHTLYDLANQFQLNGGKKLYIDEIHRYKNWSTEVKMIYDFLPSLQVVYTGSSILELEKGGADLSRRKLEYFLAGLSFREFLQWNYGYIVPVFSLEDILKSNQIEWNFPEKPLPLFKEYLHNGYYPFSKEGDFIDRLNASVETTLNVDIPQFAKMSVSTIQKIKKLFYVIAQSVPFKPNNSELARTLRIDRGELPDLYAYLAKSGLIRALELEVKGISRVSSPEKILIDNTNLSFCLSNETPDIGSLRETAFCQMTSVTNKVTASPQTDFCIGKYSFEVGGRNKGTQQISGLKEAFIVRDDTEYRYLNFIPLWHFGFLY
ncbi:MAG: AAA family ATPase [Bacteroidales bacterium]|nr:AAA family ATPase [Bacteroidales bacterium]